MKKFQYLLWCLKLWARKRGLHCHAATWLLCWNSFGDSCRIYLSQTSKC
uniref:Uncharacterized protein n=1 Tax=Arundo donax TaxID=35708 RepID=A0A0A8Z2S2_ARUDO